MTAASPQQRVEALQAAGRQAMGSVFCVLSLLRAIRTELDCLDCDDATGPDEDGLTSVYSRVTDLIVMAGEKARAAVRALDVV